MTTATDRPAEVRITPCMERIIRHMLQDTRGSYYSLGICEALDMTTGTVSPLLAAMETHGWLTVREETKAEAANRPTRNGGRRRYFRFTPGTATMLRKAIGQ